MTPDTLTPNRRSLLWASGLLLASAAAAKAEAPSGGKYVLSADLTRMKG